MRFLLAFIAALPVCAGEYAVLNSGFRVHAERHEIIGDMVRLHTSTGNLDIPAREVAQFEIEEYVKPAEAPKLIQAPSPVTKAEVGPKELIDTAAEKNGLLPEFVHSVASAESAYRQTAISPKGAIGLMQLMPGTAKELGANPHDPAQNAEAGARYLKQLLIKYQHTKDPVRLALAAYNAGPGAVDKYDGIPPYRETQQYVERVLRKYLAQLKSKKT
jgi:soluble lytic murein transglycosylase-like protein